MSRLKHDFVLRIVKALDEVLITIPFILCWLGYYSSRTAAPFYAKGNWLVVLLFVVLFVVFARIYDAFLVSINRVSEMVYSQGLAILFSDSVMFVVLWLLMKEFPNMLPALAALAAQMLLSCLWCFLANKWYFATFPAKRTGIIYDLRKGMDRLICEHGLEKKFDIQLTADIEECVDNINMIQGLEVVFLSGVHSHDRNIILKYCVANDIDVYVIPRLGDTIMSGARRMHLLHLTVLRVGRYNPTPEFLLIKRLFDIVLSLLVLIVLSPALLVASIAIKATDGGPVLYKQCRLTNGGKRFNVLNVFEEVFQSALCNKPTNIAV